MTRYYHGGYGGLRRGDIVRPSCETGAMSLADVPITGADVCRRDRVYVTTEESAARMYAAFHPTNRGKVYEVEPIGDLEPDPDCSEPGLSWQVPRARVLRVIQISRIDIESIRAALLEDA